MSTYHTAATELELGSHKELTESYGTGPYVSPSFAHPPRTSTVDDLPTVVRLAVRYHAKSSPFLSVLFALLNVANSLFPLLIFSSATSSLNIGIAFAVLAYLSQMTALAGPNFSKSPLLIQVLHAQGREVEKGIKGFIFSAVLFFGGVIMPISFHFLIKPTMVAQKWFGEHSYTVALTLMILSLVGMFGALPMNALGMVFEKVQSEWCRRIEAYMKRVREILLDVAEQSDTMEGAIANLAAIQEQNEEWARGMNAAFSTINSVTPPLLLSWTFMPLAMLAIPSNTGPRLVQVLVLCGFAAFFFMMFLVMLSGMTKVNIAWEQACGRLLNDARIQLLRLNKLGMDGRFELWLAKHELNAARSLGGMKVTLTRLRQSAGAFSSLFVVATYLILREELRNMLG